MDYNTRFRTDLRWARVLVEVADRAVVPPFLWFEVNRVTGVKSNVKVCYVFEDERMLLPINRKGCDIAQAIRHMNEILASRALPQVEN